MKQLKLEVGKTYRGREGKEVKIIKKGCGGWCPCQGDDGEWYTESGRFEYCIERPEDLIEEVTTSDANQKHNETEVLVLQVGKTYINRKVEEVKIVGKNDKDRHPYQGSNGKMYAENGKWGFLSDKHPEDIIKEVPETHHTFGLVANALTAARYTFAIPDGVKKVTVEQLGNRIVVEMVPEDKEPKPGDVMINDWNSVYIFKSDKYNGGYHTCFAWLGESGNLLIGGWCLPGRPATPEEAQPLWDALKKAGKRWNAETMEVEEITESDRIREWAEKHYSNHEGIAEAIEAYLKHKEDEK